MTTDTATTVTSISPSTNQQSAAEAVIDALIREGVKAVFGMTGDTVLPLLDALYGRSAEIRYVTTKFEMSTAAMADGYSRATGEVGCALFHVGPSVSNAVLGTWSAQKDNVPLLILSANLDRFRLGRDIWHEFDVKGVFERITKRSDQMIEAKDARRLMRTALQVAKSGLPGCVHIDFPKDLLPQPVDVETFDLSLRGASHSDYVANATRPEPESVDRALALLQSAKRPIIIAGRGVTWSRAAKSVVRLAEALSIPVITTEMGRGSIPEHHPLSGGLVGHFGLSTANSLLTDADVVLGLGCQFRNVNTLNWQLISPTAKIIQVEPDPLEIGRQYAVAVGIHADSGQFLADLLDRIAAKGIKPKAGAAIIDDIAKRRKNEKARYYDADLATTPIKPQLITKVLEDVAPRDAIYVVGSGHHTHFANYIQVSQPDQYHWCVGSGTMAWAFPAALGIKLARPDRKVIVPIGDGDFGMNAQEIETSVRENLPVTVIIYNDVSFGALRIFQKMQHGGRYIGSNVGETDWVKLAEAYGARGLRVDRPSDLEGALKSAIASEVTTIVDVRIDPWELAHRTPEFKEFHRF
jgi:acetolactate synthase I/II/III large subunit